MTVEVIPNALMKDLGIRPLFRVINDEDKFESTIVDRVRCRNDALINQAHYIREKLKENPDAEFWDFLSYVSYKTQIKLFTSTVMVSTKGRIAYQLNDGVHISTGTLSGKYLQAHIETGLDINGKSYINIYIHRAVACTFLPKPEKYKDIDYSKLEANHLDGVKTNPHFLNLEWGTKSDNLKHAVKTGLIKSGIDDPNAKPLLGTILNGSKKGYQFVICGRGAIKSLGFNVDTLYQCARGETVSGHGCTWKFITKEEYINYPLITEELAHELTSDLAKNNANTKPLIGVIAKEGTLKGNVFVIYGGKEASSYGFSQPHISKVCSGKLKSHGGCNWRYGTHEEAESLPRGLTEEQQNYLNSK